MTTSAPHNTHPIALPLLHLLHILSSLYILNNSPFSTSLYIPCSQPFRASNRILNQPINFIRSLIYWYYCMSKHSNETQQRSSRLRRQAPASIQVNSASNCVSNWKVAIPLLSPVCEDRMVETSEKVPEKNCQSVEKERIIFRSWQHPAAPFQYEPAPIIAAFVPHCA